MTTGHALCTLVRKEVSHVRKPRISGSTAKLIGVAAFAALMTLRSAALADANSREGCMNQWLFNGLWRVEVTKVEPYMNGSQQVGWQVTEVWRNGTSVQLSPGDSQLQDQRLELGNGAITAKETTSGSLSMGSLGFNNFAPAGQYTYTQVFYRQNVDPSDKPKGLEITFNGALLAQLKSKPQFTTSKYNFHFNLGCVATGAAAQAEGGSTQIAATEGCMNQWMSNGIWKVRVTAIGPNPAGAAPKDQFGWLVTQEWVNSTKRWVLPGGLFDQGRKVTPTNVTDEYLVTQSGNNASSANAVGGLQLGSRNIDWPPGGSFTFQQRFVWSPFVASDKPVRLLVTFDVAHQNAIADVPHYRKPANFRIDLTCSK